MSTEPTANDPSQPDVPDPVSAETLSFPQGARLPTPNTEPSPAGPTPVGSPFSASALTPPLVGQSFDDLELLEELGRGGMGIVFKARQKSLERLVAVKLLLAEHFTDPTRLARFHAEARAAAGLTHPNIVQVYQVGECAFGHYFSMEYIDGPSLETLIQKGRIAIPSAVQVIIGVGQAVHFAHTRGIVHRDLKPANIMIDRGTRAVVTDFGIAKFVGRPAALTQEGTIMGTPAYMAPEQAGEAVDEVGPWSDVYSLGAILYALLTNRVPYDEGTALRTILKVIGPDMPPTPRSLRPKIPEDLERICWKCLSKQPRERYASAQALVDDLRRFRSGATAPRSTDTMERPQAAATTMQADWTSVRLVSVSTGKRVRLSQAQVVVGRGSDCDLILRASDISKRHCVITVSEDEVLVEDLNSANGTYVNGKAIKRARLQHGDRLRVADHEFLVRVGESKG
jgi:serine/threonine protein kinase